MKYPFWSCFGRACLAIGGSFGIAWLLATQGWFVIAIGLNGWWSLIAVDLFNANWKEMEAYRSSKKAEGAKE